MRRAGGFVPTSTGLDQPNYYRWVRLGYIFFCTTDSRRITRATDFESPSEKPAASPPATRRIKRVRNVRDFIFVDGQTRWLPEWWGPNLGKPAQLHVARQPATPGEKRARCPHQSCHRSCPPSFLTLGRATPFPARSITILGSSCSIFRVRFWSPSLPSLCESALAGKLNGIG